MTWYGPSLMYCIFQICISCKLAVLFTVCTGVLVLCEDQCYVQNVYTAYNCLLRLKLRPYIWKMRVLLLLVLILLRLHWRLRRY